MKSFVLSLSSRRDAGICLVACLVLVASCNGSPPAEAPATLKLPRIFFAGTISADMATGNNNGVYPVVDLLLAEINPVYGDAYPTRDSFRTFMTTPVPDDEGNEERIPGYWNYYGSLQASLTNVSTTGAQLTRGQDPTEPDLGILQGATLDVSTSVFTDLHPAVQNGTSSRWFFERLIVRAESGEILITLPVRPRSFYWPDGSHGAHFFFTTSHEDAAEAIPEDIDGEVLAALRKEIERGAGIAVQAVLPYAGAPDYSGMAEKFARGEKPVNPYTGPVRAVLTPWYGAPDAEELPGRFLVAEGAAEGVVLAEEASDGRAITLEFNDTPLSAEGGDTAVETPLQLLWQEDGSTAEAQSLGSITEAEYTDQARFTLVDLGFALEDNRVLTQGPLRLVDSSGATLFAERSAVVTANPRGLWLNPGDSAVVEARLLVRGVPQRSGTIYLQQYGLDEASGEYLKSVELVQAPASLPLEAGVARFNLQALTHGYALLAYRSTDGNFPDTFSETKGLLPTYLRILPTYDDTQISDEDLTWDLLYSEVLRYYDVIFPGMSRVFDLGDEATMREYAEVVLAKLDEAPPDSPRYMPASRDLPEGKRRLLKRWLEKVSR
ncbi:MAG: hypothetical protein ABGY42_00400 [bacterium]